MPFGTGPDEPWYYNRFMDIGPFTGSDQSNMSVNQKLQLLRGLPSLTYPTQAPVVNPTPTPSSDDSYRRALAARGPQPTIEQGQKQIIAAQDFPPDTGQVQAPQFLKDWGNDLAASMGVPGYVAPPYPGSSSGSAEAAPSTSPTPSDAPAGPHVIHPPNPTIGAPAVNTPAAPAAAPSNGVNQDSMDFVQKILQAIGYPAAPSSDNAKQAAADAYAAHEMDRTKLLAQLAFAGGLTASAGGQWEDVGKGFIAAGNVYDKGQERYLKALQNSADRYSDDQKNQYAYQAKKAGIAADLYTASESQKLAQQKALREQAKDLRDARLREAQILYPKQSDNSGIFDPNAEEKRRRQASIFMNTGVPTFDMSD